MASPVRGYPISEKHLQGMAAPEAVLQKFIFPFISQTYQSSPRTYVLPPLPQVPGREERMKEKRRPSTEKKVGVRTHPGR